MWQAGFDFSQPLVFFCLLMGSHVASWPVLLLHTCCPSVDLWPFSAPHSSSGLCSLSAHGVTFVTVESILCNNR